MYPPDDSGLSLMRKLLQKNPSKRITASKALQHSFFTSDTRCNGPNTNSKNNSHVLQTTAPIQEVTLNVKDFDQSLVSITKLRAAKALSQDSCVKLCTSDLIY